MKLRYGYYLIIVLLLLMACQFLTETEDPVAEVDESVSESGPAPTRPVITPLPPPDNYLSATATSHIAYVWANTGEDKVTHEELRASQDPATVLNSVWDGTGISLFGARNEVVAFNLILESPTNDAEQVEVRLASLTNEAGETINTRADNDPFNFVGQNIELFYVRYLEIKGISTDLFFAGYDYDEQHIPQRCRRPMDAEGEGVGSWTDRPCHNLLYPEIAVPLELHTPFTIPAGMNQSIWSDIYIPKEISAGTFTGVVEIWESGSLAWEIPIALTVRDFTLPDLPAARTMLFVSAENIADRYLRSDDPTSVETVGLVDTHFQLAHRHKISLIDESVPINEMNQAWTARLSGELFTAENGYDGIGIGVGNNVYSVGTYGSWEWQEGTREDMWRETDAWVNYFDSQNFATPTDYFLYLIDESDEYEMIEQWAGWIDANPGPGQAMPGLATLDLPLAAENIPSLDIPTSWARFGVTNLWQEAANLYHNATDKTYFLYNSSRPATGSFATEDDGVALRQLPWAQYKMGVERWFYWEGTYYNNYQCYDDDRALTRIFFQAQTFGCFEEVDDLLGETGWNYLNGDGVLFYPGTNTRLPEASYGVMGPFASLRLKHWRRGIQDVDYLTLAAEIDPVRTAEIVQELIPIVLWEVGVSDLTDPSYVYADISWPTDPDYWEMARQELADIIEAGSS